MIDTIDKPGSTPSEITIGISTCLLGQKVRFDGGHKHDRYITDILGKYFQFVPVCPELEIGMGVPREPVRLTGSADAPRMVGAKTGTDWTDRMNAYADKRIRQRDIQNLSGYILKKDSPSCGMERVKLHHESGMSEKTAVGLYAKALLPRYPYLPVEEEGRLNDARLRENFIERVFACHCLRSLWTGPFRRGEVVAFHAANKYLILSHSPNHYTILGRLVAEIKKYPPSEFREEYSALFMEAMAVRATPQKNHNVLLHILGYLKDHLAPEDKKYVLDVCDDYRRGLTPLVVPLTLVKLYLTKHDVPYIAGQTYLNPHPKELLLRNHV
ncbi:MAG: DUF523 and DUF1722 domain-containing protein [candidate division Zixibacteria bacterium]|nr:DUF523 and DUF1722 domain-containing protein [candidate division Zixibacteria bacterium]